MAVRWATLLNKVSYVATMYDSGVESDRAVLVREATALVIGFVPA